MTMKPRIYILLTSALLLCLPGCREGGNTPESAVTAAENPEEGILLSQEQFEGNGMVLGNMEKKSFPTTIRANGMIDVPPENRAVVSATMGGYVKKTPLLIGDKVKKGQPLVTIENPEFVGLQQQYMEVKQQLGYLRSEYDRQKTLVAENITSQKNFLKAESDYKTATARYNGLQKQLSMLNIPVSQVEQGTFSTTATIFAPLGGSVTKMNVTKGAYVSPASPILEIIDNDHIHLELSVFEKDIMKVKKGQPIYFRIPESSAEVFDAEVYLVGTSINENRTIKVHGHLSEESTSNFLTGMFVEADIVTSNTDAPALPSEAVVSMDGETYLLQLVSQQDGKSHLQRTRVKVGISHEGYTLIEDAEKFQPTDQFLTKGAFTLIGE